MTKIAELKHRSLSALSSVQTPCLYVGVVIPQHFIGVGGGLCLF